LCFLHNNGTFLTSNIDNVQVSINNCLNTSRYAIVLLHNSPGSDVYVAVADNSTVPH
jgi:hypothetical protein